MPRKEKQPSIPERIAIFISWRKDPKHWYTLEQLANAVDAYTPSVAPALSALRRAGYVVSLRWVHSRQKYLYRIEKQKLQSLELKVDKKKI